MTDNEIIDKITYYLENEDKRLEKVERGLQFSKKYTQEEYAKRLFKELKICLL
jgi:spore maturation protein CgeB